MLESELKGMGFTKLDIGIRSKGSWRRRISRWSLVVSVLFLVFGCMVVVGQAGENGLWGDWGAIG